jgi:hypothetical protein
MQNPLIALRLFIAGTRAILAATLVSFKVVIANKMTTVLAA